jgi:Flp pilus assembly protein TadG
MRLNHRAGLCSGRSSPLSPASARRGVTLVESAAVQLVLFLLLFGVLVGGIGIFNYQEVAWLSRDASRYASVRGSGYAQATGKSSPTAQDILTQVVLPEAATMDPNQLTVQIYLVNGVTGAATDWDSSNKAPYTTDSSGVNVANRVRVQVSYRWAAPIFLGAPIPMQSTSETAMSF